MSLCSIPPNIGKHLLELKIRHKLEPRYFVISSPSFSITVVKLHFSLNLSFMVIFSGISNSLLWQMNEVLDHDKIQRAHYCLISDAFSYISQFWFIEKTPYKLRKHLFSNRKGNSTLKCEPLTSCESFISSLLQVLFLLLETCFLLLHRNVMFL